MRKFFVVGALVGAILAGPAPAMAQPVNGGLGDPLTLAGTGALVPYILNSVFSPSNTSIIEVASPVGNEPFLHLIFFNSTCDRIASASLDLTTNDIGFVSANFIVNPIPTNGSLGLVAIADSLDGNSLIPLANAIHTRVYQFSSVDGRSRVLEPIIANTAEFPDPQPAAAPFDFIHSWSPLRTAATFYAPLETSSVKTVLTLICPRRTIWVNTTQAFAPPFFTEPGPPAAVPGAQTATGVTAIFGRVYDTDEVQLRDINFNCDCLTEISIATVTGGAVYSELFDPAQPPPAIGALLGTYTEIESQFAYVAGAGTGVFTGYKNSSTVGSPQNFFFGRLSNGSKQSIRGVRTNTR